MDYGINLFCYAPEGKISNEEQIELMEKWGFNHTFIMSNSPCLTDKTVKDLSNSKIFLDTLHAPFDGINHIWEKGEKGDEMLRRLENSVKLCHIYGVPILVVHLSSGLPAPLISDAGNERFQKLMDCAEKHEVKIAYENQRCLSNISLALERFNDAMFCWDAGHEGCFTQNLKFMPIFGSRLAALHLHDNYCIYNEDNHLLPYDGKLDYGYVAKALAEVDFDGTLMIEAFRSHGKGFYDNFTADDYYKRAADNIKRLRKEIENLKSQNISSDDGIG